MTLNDRINPVANSRPMVQLRARQLGAPGITVNVTDTPVLNAVAVYRPQAALASAAAAGDAAVVVAADGPIPADQVANRFKPGDEVSFSVGTDRRVVSSVSGDAVRFAIPLNSALGVGDTDCAWPIRQPERRTIRLRPAGAGPLPAGQLVPGTILTVTQGAASDTQIVDSVISEVLTEGPQGGLSGFSYRVTFRTGLNIQLDMDPAGAAVSATSNEIQVDVTLGAVIVSYPQLSMDPSHPRYLIAILNADAGGLLTASLIEPPPPNTIADAIPRTGVDRHGSRRAGRGRGPVVADRGPLQGRHRSSCRN